jgi:hypothetical protein
MATAWLIWTFASAVGSPPAPPPSLVAEKAAICEDPTTAQVQIAAKLDSAFFSTLETSRPSHIITHEDGRLEDTVDGSIDEEDLILLEHSSACVSTHQGEHAMSFCEARITDDGRMVLLIYGGAPAYSGSLTVNVDTKSGNFTCVFDALYPSPTPTLTWRITRKSMHVRMLTAQPGHRFYAWVSVEFDEVWTENGTEQKRSYKIEGPIKPVIRSPSKKE